MYSPKFPWQFDIRGRTATSEVQDHIREMIELVLFTGAGERVNRPEFGCGVLHNVIEGNTVQLAVALQSSMAAGLNRWLSDVIEVQELDVNAVDSTLFVGLNYMIRVTGEIRSDMFERRNAL